MLGDIIKTYLVKLGVQDNLSQQLGKSLKESSNKMNRFVGSWGKRWMLAGSTVVTGLAMANIGVAKFISKVATADDALTDFARQTGLTREEAFLTKSALDAMGKSMEEIQADPKLLAQYETLRKHAEALKPPDMTEGLEQVRTINLEFTKLKQTGGAAIQWVGHYLLKYIAAPMQTINRKMGGINATLVKNLPVWSEKIGMSLAWITRLGLTLIRGAGAVFNAIKRIFDMIPKDVKIAMASLAALGLFIRAGPIGQLIMILSAALLLLEDFFTYLDGGESLLAPVWETLVSLFDGFKSSGKGALQWFAEDFLPGLCRMAIEMFPKLTAHILSFVDSFLDFGLAVIEGLATVLADGAPQLIQCIGQLALQLISTLIQKIPKFLDAGGKMLLALANGLIRALPHLLRAAVELLKQLLTMIADNLPELVRAGASLLLSLLQGFAEMAPELLQMLCELLLSLLAAIAQGLPQLVSAGVEILKSLGDGILSMLPTLGKLVLEIIKVVLDGLASLPGAMLELGKTLIQSLWNGITAMGGWLKDKLSGFVGGIANDVKGIFDSGDDPKPQPQPQPSGGHADGGVFDKEHVARFAEGNQAEAVIPLTKPQRAKQVIGQALQYLGGGGASAEAMASSMQSFMQQASSMLGQMKSVMDTGAAAATQTSEMSVVNNNQRYDMRSNIVVNDRSGNPKETAKSVDRMQQLHMRNMQGVLV